MYAAKRRDSMKIKFAKTFLKAFLLSLEIIIPAIMIRYTCMNNL